MIQCRACLAVASEELATIMSGHEQQMSDGLFSFEYKALVLGSGGAIGQAFAQAFNSDPLCSLVKTVSRSDGSQFDLEDPESIAQAAMQLTASGPFHVIVDATGALVIDGVGPEKSLRALRQASLMRSFQVNAIGPALVLREFSPLLASGRAIFAKLSARVGSIADNKLGGWYGYRASKAALNMLLQTAAIELQRKNPDLMVVALQPGTVSSDLSKPFTSAIESVLTPAASVAGMLSALAAITPRYGAHFIDYRGNEIPW